MRDAGCVGSGDHSQSRSVRRFFYPESGCAEVLAQRAGVPACRLQGQRRPHVVPCHETRRFVGPKARSPPLRQPLGMRAPRIPHLASRIPGHVAQQPVDVPRRTLPSDLAGERDTRGDGRVGRHAGETAQLVGTEPQDVAQAGIDTRNRQQPVELGAPAQHAGRELVGEPAVARRQGAELAVARHCEGGAGIHLFQDLERRAPRGGDFLNPASPRAGRTASRSRGAACGPRGTRRAPPQRRDALREPWPRAPARRRARCS